MITMIIISIEMTVIIIIIMILIIIVTMTMIYKIMTGMIEYNITIINTNNSIIITIL